MIDKKIFMKYMKKLSIAFTRLELDGDTLGLYYEYLGGYSEDELQYAVNKCISTCKYVPTIAELKTAIEDLKPNGDEKAREFESKLFSCSTDTLLKHFENIGDETAVKVIKRNYDTMRNTMIDDIGVIKAQLREQYKNISRLEEKKHIQANILNPNVLTEKEKIALTE